MNEKIKELRKEKGITQVELAKALGFSHSIVGFWESGERKPAFDAIIALAKFFEVSADYLLGLKED
jgi:transcriptional regulator with XRE-family HTH domain